MEDFWLFALRGFLPLLPKIDSWALKIFLPSNTKDDSWPLTFKKIPRFLASTLEDSLLLPSEGFLTSCTEKRILETEVLAAQWLEDTGSKNPGH
jgi:hypothetical protein